MVVAPDPAAGRRTTLVAFLVLLVVISVPVIALVRPYALTLLMSAIVAALVEPLYRHLRRRFRARAAGLLVTLGILVLVVGPVAGFMYAALQQAIVIANAFARGDIIDLGALEERLRGWGLARRLLGEPAAIEAELRGALARGATAASNLVLGALAQVPSLVLNAVLAIIGCYFFLVDGRRLGEWLGGKIPLPPQVQDVLVTSFRNSAGAVVLASLAAAGAQASVTLVVFLALRVPGAFVAAGIVFVLAWLPMIGITPVYAVGAGWLFHEHGIVQVLLLVAGGFAAGVADNIVRPAVLGGRHQMHPLVSLVAIFGGIATFGLFGVLVGPILAAVFIALLDTWPIVARHCGIQVSETGTVPELDAPQEPPRRP